MTNINIRISKLSAAVSIIFLVAGCNPTKYVPEGESLLKKNEINIFAGTKEPAPEITKSAIKPYIRQIPNKRIFGTRFHLSLYNLSNIEKNKWPHTWLRNIGEEPVIFDKAASQKSEDQIKSFLSSKGYFNANVKATDHLVKKEMKVIYDIKPGTPYTVGRIKYEISDSVLSKLILMDTVNCLINRGMIYDVDIMQQERQRLERFIKNIGYYSFSSEDIFFRVDSAMASHKVDIYYNVSQKPSVDEAGNIVYSPHQLYRVRNVFIYPEFDPKEALRQGESYASAFDTINYQGLNFISPPGKQYIKPAIIKQSMYVMPGSLYNLNNTEQSHSHLTALKNHRLISISYRENKNLPGQRYGEETLDCIVQMTPVTRQSYSIELEGTNTSGNLGGALNLIYQNKNLFRGAENFNLRFKGAYETLTEKVRGFKNSQEFGVDASLQLPKFLVPFPSKENFIRKHDPKTSLQLGYNYQKLPVYTRTVANMSVGYLWKGNKYTNYTLNPLFLDVVNLPFIDREFKAKVDSTSYLAFSYRDMMIVGGNVTYVFNNQNIQKSKDYWYARLSFDAAGNLLSLGYKTAGATRNDTTNYKLFGQDFAQYVKAEADVSYHRKLNEASSVVYRVLAGVGWPYGNSKVMPFEEQYFGGGANDIRAWTVRSLGPGSFKSADSTSFINQTADIKLEANAEYRFKLFWVLEGALFADAGNIWTFHEDHDRPGAQFKIDKFIDDFAVGVGFGLRFDLKFVLLRADLGLKMRDPEINSGSKWIPLSRPFDIHDDTAIAIGIGYPF